MKRTAVRGLLVALATAGSVVAAAVPGQAVSLPVGSGTWGPSPNVTATNGCATAGGCTLTASSKIVSPATETCQNASYTLTQPVIVGTNFGCHVTLTVDVELTGASSTQSSDSVEITTGPCAGLTLSDAHLVVQDNATGTYDISPRLVATNVGLSFEGNYVGANVGSLSAVLIHAAGSVTPACSRVTYTTGETRVSVYGVFQGSYQIL